MLNHASGGNGTLLHAGIKSASMAEVTQEARSERIPGPGRVDYFADLHCGAFYRLAAS